MSSGTRTEMTSASCFEPTGNLRRDLKYYQLSLVSVRSLDTLCGRETRRYNENFTGWTPTTLFDQSTLSARRRCRCLTSGCCRVSSLFLAALSLVQPPAARRWLPHHHPAPSRLTRRASRLVSATKQHVPTFYPARTTLFGPCLTRPAGCSCLLVMSILSAFATPLSLYTPIDPSSMSH
jgi:hypothetical protein